MLCTLTSSSVDSATHKMPSSPDIKLGEQECGLTSVERLWKCKPHLKELATVDVVAQDHIVEAPHFPLPLGQLLPLHLQLLLVMLPALLHLLKPQVLRCQLALHANAPSINASAILDLPSQPTS